ncbi:MAG: efflux RND transporter permease subunit [Balneolaceae bacterium]|nr:efflux RND transporter permease subunit [Balneolaceae bacterium]
MAQPIGNVHIDGEDGVILNVYRQSDANVVTAASEVVSSMEELQGILPGDVTIDVLTNKADFIEMSINNLLLTGLQAVILVVLILLAFLAAHAPRLLLPYPSPYPSSPPSALWTGLT